MKLKITAIRDAGDIAKERIVMKASNALDMGAYVLLQTGFKDGSVNTGIFQSFWFPDKMINEGDFVILYTKAGRASEKDFKDVKSHFLYWGKSSPIWSESGRAAVLFHAPEWESFTGHL